MAVLAPTLKVGVGDDIPTAAASAGGDMVTNTNGVTVHFYNGDVSSKNVTVKSYYPGTPPGGTIKSDLVVAVAANAIASIGPLDPPIWNNPATGQVELTYSAVTSCRVGAFTVSA